MAAESGERRAAKMRALAADHAAKADNYRRVAEAIEKGNAGEHKIAGLLDVLDGAGWVVLNDRYKSASSRANIDHILVGPPGVCVIDSKNWASGRVSLDDRGMSVGRYRRDDQLAGARDAAQAVSIRATQVVPTVITAPVTAFASDVALGAPAFHHGVMCMQAEHMLRWLTDQPPALTSQQVHQLGSALDAAFPPRIGSAKPLTVAAVARYPEAPAVRRGRTRPAAARPQRRPSALPTQPGLRAHLRHAALSAVHDLVSLMARAAIAIVLIGLVLFVGLPVMTKLMTGLVDRQMSTLVPTPSRSPGALQPAVRTGNHAPVAPQPRPSARR